MYPPSSAARASSTFEVAMTSICATCAGLQKHPEDTDGDPNLAPVGSVRLVRTTLPDLRRSSEGCHPCALILQGILSYHALFTNVEENRVGIIAKYSQSGQSGEAQGRLSVELRWEERQDGSSREDGFEHEEDYPDLELEFFTAKGGESLFSAIRPGRHIVAYPLRGLVIQKISSMMKNCRKPHFLCGRGENTPLPRRVLDRAIVLCVPGPRLHAMQIWNRIVSEYTARSLSHDADRLLAIADVTKTPSVASITARYIAGLWANSVLGLLWHPREGTHCRRPEQTTPWGNVPSWFWASVEGSEIWCESSTAMDLACSAFFSNPDPSNGLGNKTWSPVGGGILYLRATMAAEVTLQENKPEKYSLARNGISVEFEPDVIPLRGEDAVEPNQKLICVLISMSYRVSVVGLVLKQLPSEKELYRRIGRFECYECVRDGSEEEPQDAETLFEHWFPEVEDMMTLDFGPQRTFQVV